MYSYARGLAHNLQCVLSEAQNTKFDTSPPIVVQLKKLKRERVHLARRGRERNSPPLTSPPAHSKEKNDRKQTRTSSQRANGARACSREVRSRFCPPNLGRASPLRSRALYVCPRARHLNPQHKPRRRLHSVGSSRRKRRLLAHRLRPSEPLASWPRRPNCFARGSFHQPDIQRGHRSPPFRDGRRQRRQRRENSHPQAKIRPRGSPRQRNPRGPFRSRRPLAAH